MNNKTIDKIISRNIVSSKENIRQSIIRKLKFKYSNIWNYIVDRYDDSESIPETIYRMYFGIEERPVCKICGNKVSYRGKGKYRDVCSFKCGEIFSREKRQNTMLRLYGVTIPIKNLSIKEKIKNTCLEKYGVDNPSKVGFVKKKKEETCLKNYGVTNPSLSKEIVYKRSIRLNSSEVKKKIYDSKIKNHSFGKSKEEDWIYGELKVIYGEVKRQYKCPLYPYMCDFYIPKIDTYIEYQGYFTHGSHPFDISSKEDNDKLEALKKRYGTNSQAVTIWSKCDVEKRNLAKKNNLNYVELFNIKEAKVYINNLKLSN